jgi:hypothetical protein
MKGVLIVTYNQIPLLLRFSTMHDALKAVKAKEAWFGKRQL